MKEKKPDFRKLAKHLYDMAEKNGIDIHLPEQDMEKTVRYLLNNVKYNGGEQENTSKKSWKGKLRSYAIMASALATGALVYASTTDTQSIYGGHN